MEQENFFDSVYKSASHNLVSIPWVKLKPNELLTDFLATAQIEPSQKALVIGCGVGDDADVLQRAGFVVDAIDISPTAIEIAKGRFVSPDINFTVADIFALPKQHEGRYDVVYEGLTIQSIPRAKRKELIKIIASLVAPKGTLLVYAHRQEDTDNMGGPPWPLYRHEFDWILEHGFEEISTREQPEPKPIAPYNCSHIYKRHS
jgi:SAM-dependent methyltransferase